MSHSIKQAVILAGGPGLRLRPLTADKPKPMVLVAGRPFIDYLLEFVKKNGIEEVLLLLGYLPEKITGYVGDGSKFGLKVKYSVSPVENLTGTRMRIAKDMLRDEFLLMYCDNLLNLDVEELYKFHKEHGGLATVTVYTNKHGLTKNNMFVDKDGFVVKYDKERKNPAEMNGVDMGFFIVNKKAVDLIPDENVYFELSAVPKLIEQRQLAGFTTDRFYYSTGSPARLEQTAKFLSPQKVIFLDRDGVINKKMDVGDYVKKWEEFEFLPGTVEAMRFLTENGYRIFIISNQAGVARGKMTPQDLWDIEHKMEEEMGRTGAKITGFYYCLHDRDEGCDCRKPKPGLLFQAALDHYIHLPNAVFVGDDERDKQAGDAAGVKTILVGGDKNLLDVVKSLIQA